MSIPTRAVGRNRDAAPWWQVDLGKSLPLDHMVIYNRCDGTVEDRAARLAVLLSDDGRSWTEFYRHDGTTFFGQTDVKPLVIPADGAKAETASNSSSYAVYRLRSTQRSNPPTAIREAPNWDRLDKPRRPAKSANCGR
jgi:hypothetical protein